MKKIEIITRPEKLDDIKRILLDNDYAGMTVTAAMGCGHQKGSMKELEKLEIEVNLLPKIHVMTVVWDEDAEEIICELQEKLSTGTTGDGKIFVSNVEDVIRIRNGERGEKTL